ncbi:WD40 repeat protein [Nocardiopsis sp. Huas11]|uniref:WD40 repeat domain-containing protein n=1 Tax=Nocardiopsis sp. Huas11 TaxID=2183912 RepID=UPI000F29D766|nr:WD40 repeat domain-containing protein [Nocardiopsis sp. Huas11]RKS09187.1 WD40 repeat protein [Nocardiopsis sp. Huas11]
MNPSDAPRTADHVLTDATRLVHADPDEILPLLPRADSAPARLAAAVYRTSAHRHRRVDPARRAQALVLDAARWGADALARDLAAVPVVPGQDGATVDWNTGTPPDNRLIRRFSGRTDHVAAVVTAVLDGRPVVVTGSFVADNVRVWDPATGTELREPTFANPTAVATTVLDGRPVIVTGELLGGIRRFDLATGAEIGTAMASHGSAQAIVTTRLAGRPVAVSCAHASDAVQVWDLEAETRVGEPLNGHTGLVKGADLAQVDGRAVLVTSSVDGTVRLWDLAEGTQIGEPLDCHSDAVATTVLDGRPVAVTGGPGNALLVWDLADRTLVGAPLYGHDLGPADIAVAEAGGRPIAVSAGYDRTVRLWDLAGGTQIGGALTDHTDAVTSVAVTELDGRPVAVTASRDETVSLWDVSPQSPDRPRPVERKDRPVWRVDWSTGADLSERALTSILGGSDELASGFLHGRPVVVSADDRNLRVLDPATGEQVGEPLTGHREWVTAVAVTELEGRAVAVSASADSTVRLWDLAESAQIGEPMTGHTRTVWALAVTEVEGRVVAVTGGADRTVRLWDLAERAQIGEPLEGHTAPVAAIAVTELDGRPAALVAGGAFPQKETAVHVWDLATREPLGAPLDAGTCEVRAIATTVLDDGPVAVVVARDTTIVWDLTTRTEIRRLPIELHNPRAIAVARVDGRAVAAIGDGTGEVLGSAVRLWDLATGDLIGGPLATDETKAATVAELDGRPVAITGGKGSVCLWDLSASPPAAASPRPGHVGGLVAAAITELDGRPVAVTAAQDGGTVRTWDLDSGERVGAPIDLGYFNDMAVTEVDGRPVAVISPDIDFGAWDLATGGELLRHPTDHDAEVLTIAVARDRDRQLVITGTGDNAVSAHVLDTGARAGQRRTTLHYDPVRAAAVAEDAQGRPLVVTVGGFASHEANVWQARNGRQVCWADVGHTDAVNAVVTLPLNGRTVAVTAGRDRAVRVWDIEDGRAVLTPLNGHTGSVEAMAAAVVDGRPLVVSGGEDRTVRVWDLADDHPVGDEIVFPHPVTALALSSQGRLVVCFGGDVAVFTRVPAS